MRTIPYIPFLHTDARLRDQYIEQFKAFLTDKNYILGHHVADFERSWAAYCQTRFAIGVGNGFDALLLGMKALGIQEGDEVIVPAHTFAASVLPVLHCGARPVLAEVDPETCNIDPAKVRERISPSTRAIMAVHLYGNPCDLDALTTLCQQHDIWLLEDNAQAHGATYHGCKTGSFGVLSATSFYPVKNLGALGDGGAVNTDDERLNKKLRLLRSYGSHDKHEFTYAGFNSRLDALQAMMLQTKLDHLDAWITERRSIAQWYRKGLQGLPNVRLLSPTPGSNPSYHIFPIFCKKRDELRAYLSDHGVQTLRHYPNPYHLERAFQRLGYKADDFAITEALCQEEISLPVYPGLSMEDVLYVCEVIRKFLDVD